MSQDSRIFQANLANLDAMMAWIRNVIEIHGFSVSGMRKFELVIEEALVNIVNYAYVDRSGLIEVQYHWDEDKSQLTFRLIDQGIPFNPLRHNLKLDIASRVEDRKEGGLGIHFMKELTDYIDYQRQDDSNILVLSVKVA